MSATDIERLTDVIVELLPGQRDLAERVAGVVWRDEATIRADAWDEGLRAGTIFAIDVRERAKVVSTDPWPEVPANPYRAGALSGDENDERLPGRDQAARPGDRRTEGESGMAAGIGDGTSEGDQG